MIVTAGGKSYDSTIKSLRQMGRCQLYKNRQPSIIWTQHMQLVVYLLEIDIFASLHASYLSGVQLGGPCFLNVSVTFKSHPVPTPGFLLGVTVPCKSSASEVLQTDFGIILLPVCFSHQTQINSRIANCTYSLIYFKPFKCTIRRPSPSLCWGGWGARGPTEVL